MRIRVALVLFLIVMACGDEKPTGKESPEYLYSWASVDSVDVTSRSEKAVELQLFGWLPEGCSEFASADVTFQEPDSLLVQVTSKRPRDLNCTLAIISYSTSIDLTVPHPGTYGVRFYSSVGTPWITSITFD